ncbi:hypothetical protein TruAng_005961 [Truncatella angustata]|nr:hypothetical protein TruAng_005961 [Truncatella angustata]
MDVDEPLLLFRSQYLQCVDHDFLAWPPSTLLRQPDALQFLFRRMFDTEKLLHRPPVQYELRILKTLVTKIERVTGQGVSGSPFQNLRRRLTDLENQETSQGPLATQDAYLTYNCTSSLSSWRPVILHESRSRISGSSRTGHRTWEGALHLASYLLSSPSIIDGLRVLELGAGTGFLSILCRKYLNAQYVTATDGDDMVVAEMQENLLLNGRRESDNIVARKLWWGSDLSGNWRERVGETEFDVVIAADVIYQEEATRLLVQALRAISYRQPGVKILMANALRFPNIFEIFRHECEYNNLSIHVVKYQMTPPPKQKALFYSTAMPLQIVEIRNCQKPETS